MVTKLTTRHVEAVGFLCIVGGLAAIWWPSALLVGGLLLILGAYVRGGNAG